MCVAVSLVLKVYSYILLRCLQAKQSKAYFHLTTKELITFNLFIMIQDQENSHPNHKRSSSSEHDPRCSKQPKNASTPSNQNAQEEFSPTPAQIQAAKDLLSKPFQLPDLNGQLPTPDEIQAAKDAVYHHIRAKVFASENPQMHVRFLFQLKDAIYRMGFGVSIYLFSGKCPVPNDRGGFSLDDLPPNFNYADNDTTCVFAHIIKGLPKDFVFPFNIRDICQLCPDYGEEYGFCKKLTDIEAILLVFCLNDVGRLGKWIGAKVFLCNIGGEDLTKVYRGRIKGPQKFSGIDESLFEVVFSGCTHMSKYGTHLSNCMKHRRVSFKVGPEHQKAVVYAFLTALLDVLNLQNNLRPMINDHRLEMVVDLMSPDYQEAARAIELEKQEAARVKALKKEMTARVNALIASGQSPTSDDLSNPIFEDLWRAKESARAKALNTAKPRERRRRAFGPIPSLFRSVARPTNAKQPRESSP
jgi:hypothetical protein